MVKKGIMFMNNVEVKTNIQVAREKEKSELQEAIDKQKSKRLYHSRLVRKNKARNFWNHHKVMEGCFCCKGSRLTEEEKLIGESYDSHHVHEGGKRIKGNGNTIGVSDMVKGGYSIEKIKQELEQCVTLCTICHKLWHRKLIYINFTNWKNFDPSKALKI